MYHNPSSLRIKAVGDICPGNALIDGLGMRTITNKYGCDYPFKRLGDLRKGTDILIGNLEGTISKNCFKNKYELCGQPEFVKVLHDIGFDLLSVANNHSFDYGPEILEETISHCTKWGIKICGLRGKTSFHSQPIIIDKNSMSIGFLAYNWVGLDNASQITEHIATASDGVVNYTWNRDTAKNLCRRIDINEKNKNVLNDIKMLRNKVDILILMPHWGYEWTIFPPYGVILEAKTFIDSGVDLIIGSHPHIPQGIQEYNNGLIAYSLGNFLFDGISDRFKYGMVLECEIESRTIRKYFATFVKRGFNFQIEPVSQEEHEFNLLLINKSNEAILSNIAEQILDDELIYREYENQYNSLKLKKIIYLLKTLPGRPFIIKPIIRKLLNLLGLIFLRLQGKKIRW